MIEINRFILAIFASNMIFEAGTEDDFFNSPLCLKIEDIKSRITTQSIESIEVDNSSIERSLHRLSSEDLLLEFKGIVDTSWSITPKGLTTLLYDIQPLYTESE